MNNPVYRQILIIICMMPALLYGASPNTIQPVSEASALSAPLVISIDSNYYPLSFVDEQGKASGLFVDIWHLWAEKTGQKITFLPSTWDGTLKTLRAGDADIHSGLFESEERATWIDFSSPFYGIGSTLFYASGESPYRGLADLKGQSVGAVNGAFQADYLRKQGASNVVLFDTRHEMINALRDGHIQAFLSEVPTTQALLDRLGRAGGVEGSDKILFSKRVYAGVAKGNLGLLERVNSGLAAISANEFSALERRWIAYPGFRYFKSTVPSLLQSLNEEERLWLAEHPVIRMGGESDWPPFDFVEDGVYQGLTADYLALLSERLGVEFEMVVENPWAVTLAMLENREVDAIAAIWETLERGKFALFTSAYEELSMVVFTRTEDAAIKGIDDLRDATVAVVHDYATQHSLAADYPEIKQLEVENTLAALEAVSQGRADAYIGTLAVAGYLLEKHFISNIKVAGKTPLEERGVSIGIRSDWPILTSILEKGLNSITTTEKIEIRRRWISLSSSNPNPQIELTASERAWLSKHPVVRIGIDANWPPLEFLKENGVPQGLSADYLALLSQRLGVEFEMVVYHDWPATLVMLENKQLDALSGVIRTDEREKFALFTHPYNEISAVIYTRQQHPPVDSIFDLSGHTIAIESGYASHDALRRDYPDISLLVVDTSLQALEAVSQGRADAYIGTLAVGGYLLEKHFITNLKVAANSPFDMEALSIGVRNDWPELVSILNKGLNAITATEHIDIRRRWISADLPQPESGSKIVELTHQERAWLQEHPTVRFTGDPNWLPFEAFTEQGEFIGIISELLNNLEQRTGVKFERLPSGTWLNALAMVKSGEVDLISNDVEAKGIEHSHTFTKPYLERQLAIVMRSEQTEVIPDLNDIADKRIAVIDGYGYVDKLSQHYPDIDFIKVEDVQDGLIGLSSGRLDAFITTFTLSSYHINQMGMSNLRIVGGLPVVVKMGLAVRNDWPELLTILNKAIDLITPAEKHEIANRWMQDKYIKRIDYELVKQVVLIAAVVLLLMLLWNYSVQRQKARLRLSEERFQLAMAAASDGIWDWNIVTGETYYSPAYMNMLGYSPGELPEYSDTWQMLLHPDDKNSALAMVESAIRNNASRYEHEFRLQAKDGSYRDILSKGSVVSRDKQGKALRAVGTQADITERKQAQESLRKLSLAVEQSPSMVMITDRYGVIEYVNPKFTEVTGFTSEEALGQTPALLKSDLTSAATYQNMWQTITAGHEWYGDLQNRKKNGEIYWERETISPLMGDDGVIKHYVALKEDITKRKAVEEDLQVFRRFAETSGQGFGITTLGGEITYVNQTLCQMMKEESVDAVCGHDFSHYYSAETSAYFQQEIMPFLKENNQWTGELPLLTATGETIPTLESLFVIRDEQGKARFFGNVITDITLQKNTEQVLQEAKDQAEQANQSKGEFLANMSHEIRSPLNAVTGMTYLLQKTPLTTRQQDYLNVILSSSNTLLGVINDILDFSKIEAGHLKMEQTRFLLDDVFKNLSSLESLRASQKELEIVFSVDKDIPQAVVGDPLRLGQILINLTSNAIKFTERGQIVVSVVPVSLQSERIKLCFSVQDTGIGIEQSKAAELFEPFTQADGSTTRQYGGTGLGLAICKQLVELMNGSIGVESEVGRGSRFYFDVEFTRADDEGEMSLLPPPDLSGMRVLVVDDNAVARETLQSMLESFSFDVSVVSSGAEALVELERAGGAHSDGYYDLVLMDWKMPGMDGVEASRLIQQSDWLPQLPTVIMVTAYSRDEVMKEAHKVGIEGFLVKPVNASTLFNAIVEALTPSSGGEILSVPISTPAINLSGARVLVVEDNHINQRIAREILQGVGVEVEIAANGAIAVQAIRNGSFDLVLMDLQMPEMDGYQATRMIRKDEQFNELPIIAMTAHAMAGDREKCLDAGMNDHLTKPIDPDHLFAVLQRWIGIIDPVGVHNARTDSTEEYCSGLPLGNLLGIDLSKGLARIGGNQTLFLSLLQEFVDDHQADSITLDDALNAGDMVSARRLIHTLRSVAGSIGAEALEESAATLEQALASDKLYPEAHAAFLVEFNQVMNSLVDALANVSTPTVEKTAECEVIVNWEGIQTLSVLLFEGNASAKACFQQCKSGLAQFAEEEEISSLEGQIADYDFTEAHDTLLRMVARSDRPTYLQGSS